MSHFLLKTGKDGLYRKDGRKPRPHVANAPSDVADRAVVSVRVNPEEPFGELKPQSTQPSREPFKCKECGASAHMVRSEYGGVKAVHDDPAMNGDRFSAWARGPIKGQG